MNTHHDPISFEKQIIMTLKGFRRSKKITQTQLANRIGVSRDTIARIESGKARIYLAQVVAIAEALNIMLQDLFLQDEQEEKMIDESMTTSQQNVHITFLPQPMISSPIAGKMSERQPVRRSFSVGGVGISYAGEDTEGRGVLQTLDEPTAPATASATIPNPYLNQPAVDNYGEPMKDYILNHHLFWHWVPEDKLTGLSISSVVEATLNQGNEKDISHMFKMIGIEKAANVFKRGISGFRTNYREGVILYFSNYFKRHVPGYSD